MEGRIYVLNNRKIKEEILKENHVWQMWDIQGNIGCWN